MRAHYGPTVSVPVGKSDTRLRDITIARTPREITAPSPSQNADRTERTSNWDRQGPRAATAGSGRTESICATSRRRRTQRRSRLNGPSPGTRGRIRICSDCPRGPSPSSATLTSASRLALATSDQPQSPRFDRDLAVANGSYRAPHQDPCMLLARLIIAMNLRLHPSASSASGDRIVSRSHRPSTHAAGAAHNGCPFQGIRSHHPGGMHLDRQVQSGEFEARRREEP